jgi:SPP1 family phage portal protein
LPLPADGDASFITKDIAIEAVKVILDEIRKNIYQFARSIDLSKDYGGDLRVIGWQVALLNLENSCKVTERKFKAALREQYRLIGEKWRQWGVADLNYLDLRFTFTRNFPKDLASEAKILLDLLGAVSRKTAYEQMSFIDDVDAEIEAFDAQAEMNLNLFGITDDTGSGEEPEESE